MAARVARAIAIQRHEGERGHASFVDSRLDAGIQEQRRIGGRYGERRVANTFEPAETVITVEARGAISKGACTLIWPSEL